MTTTEEPVDPAEQDTSGTPAQTVRVPNVSPNAKSGLDHTIIGSNALADAGQAEENPDEEEAADDPVPQGDLDAALAYVEAAEDSDTARERADAVWAAYAVKDTDDPSADPANADLAERLRTAVYGKTEDPEVTVPDGLTGEALSDWVSGDAVEGDETENPERFAAYQARRKAAGLDQDPNATDADES